jgi:hypothetical protein
MGVENVIRMTTYDEEKKEHSFHHEVYEIKDALFPCKRFGDVNVIV